MMKWLVGAGMIVLTGLAAEPAAAQVRLGVQANYADGVDFGVGIRAQSSLAQYLDEESPLNMLMGAASVDYYFPSCATDCSYFEVNGNVLYPLQLGEGWSPYVGGGLHLGRFGVDSSGPGNGGDTRMGLNAVGGAGFDLGGLDAFGEAKLGLGGWEQFVIRFGILIGGG